MTSLKALRVGDDFFACNFSVTHNANGFDEISFQIQSAEDLYSRVVEETVVTYMDKIYRIKSISDNGKYAKIECSIDLYDFESEIFKEVGTSKEPLNITVTKFFQDYCPKTWEYTIVNDNNETQEWKESKTTFKELLKKATDKYGIFYDIDNKNKKIKVMYVDDVEYTGNYITQQLNIKSSSYQGDSYKLVTRLYCYGKDDITIESVNGGKPYIEDFSYTTDIISGVFTDTSIETASKLLEEGQKKLKEMCYPTLSYSFKIARLNDDYALPDIGINKLVKYLDTLHKRVVTNRIVKWVEYPNDPLNDSLTLNNVETTIEQFAKGE